MDECEPSASTSRAPPKRNTRSKKKAPSALELADTIPLKKRSNSRTKKQRHLGPVEALTFDESDDDGELEKKAYLTRVENFEDVIDEAVAFELAPDWSTPDLAAIFSRVRNVRCTESGVSTFVGSFANTTTADILQLLGRFQTFAREVESKRSRLNEFLESEETDNYKEPEEAAKTSASVQLSTLAAEIHNRKKTRAINSDRLRECFAEMGDKPSKKQKMPASSDIFSKAVQLDLPVDYPHMYKCLMDMAIIKKPRATNPLESAILVDIFDEMQEIADNPCFDKHVAYLRQHMKDIKSMTSADIGLLEEPTPEETGKKMWNVFNLPDEILNLSQAYAKRP